MGDDIKSGLESIRNHHPVPIAGSRMAKAIEEEIEWLKEENDRLRSALTVSNLSNGNLRDVILEHAALGEKRQKENEELMRALSQAENKIGSALLILEEDSQVDGAHHKAWVIDQIARALTDDEYERWVEDYCEGDTYEWDEGVIP